MWLFHCDEEALLYNINFKFMWASSIFLEKKTFLEDVYVA